MERTGLDVPTEDVHLPCWTGSLPSARRGVKEYHRLVTVRNETLPPAALHMPFDK